MPRGYDANGQPFGRPINWKMPAGYTHALDLKRERDAAGVTVRDVAKALGLSKGYVSLIEDPGWRKPEKATQFRQGIEKAVAAKGRP